MRWIPHFGFWVFVIIYGIFKYRAVPEQMGQAAYIQSTLILIMLTAIVPYFVTWFATKKISDGNVRNCFALFLPLVLCVVGLALYFYMFIAPNAPGFPVTKVLPRAIVPGLVMGVILFLYLRNHGQQGRLAD